jgi:hypothetical protein
MLVQWCLKGIAERPTGPTLFSDNEAHAAVDKEGLRASWLRNQSGAAASDFAVLSHPVLSQIALDAHVNGFGTSAPTTPYLSLSAGCVEIDPTYGGTRVFSALQTALEFATLSGQTNGYVFRMWVLVSPKPAPELPGFAEEVRELNLYQQFCVYHREGEIAAKLFVPARQIASVQKFDANLQPIGSPYLNKDFVPPERVSNVLEML